MKQLLATAALLILVTVAATAQNRASIKGKVVDSLNNQTMEFATVAVLDAKDTSLISYTLTIKGGDFSLHNLPSEKPLKLVVSFISYSNYRKIINLPKGGDVDLGAIKLSPKGNRLNEVTVTADITPIIIKKDTVEFSAEAFKTPPNAVVEELLKRLPGIQVDVDGTITVNGKKVSKLLIDGKQFFVNDPKIASRNLDAALIDKVQVYDDRDNDPDHLVPESKVDKIINLKFKNAIKKSTFGKVRVGEGTEDRFDDGLLYNMFRDTLQISLIGIGNNLNRTGFSTQELSSQGGFNRSGNDALYNGSVATGGRGYGGIETVGSGGLNINTDYGKKLKLNLLYFYGYTSDIYNTSSVSQQSLSDTTLNTNAASTRHTTYSKHSISGLVEWNPDTLTKIRYTPSATFTGNGSSSDNANFNFSNFVPQLNASDNTFTGNGNTFAFQHSFSYYRRLHKKGASLNITNSISLSPHKGHNYTDNNFTSFTTLLPSSDLNRLADVISDNSSGSLGITYRYPLSKKFTGSISGNTDYYHNNGTLFTYNQDPTTTLYTMYIDSLSHNLTRTQYTETLHPELEYRFNDETALTANVGLQFMQTNSRFNKNIPDIDRRDVYLLPSIRFYTQYFSVDYDVSIRQPSINDMLPLTTFYNQLYSTTGNPDLQATRSHSFSGSYYKYKNETMFGMNFYTGVTLDENSVFTEKTISSQDATIAKPTNKSGHYSAYLGGSINKGFKKIGKWQFKLSDRVSGSFGHNFFQVNSSDGYQNTASFNFNQQVSVDWDNKIDINPSYSLNPSITTYQNVDYNAVKYVSQSLAVPLIARWPKHYTIETNYTYTYNPLVAPGFQRSVNVLNIAFARQIQKRDRGEIRLSCYDLFNQNVSSGRFTTGNTIVDYQSQILKRYFLLSYAYRFNNTVTAKKPAAK